MPTLICDLRSAAATWAAEYEQLRVAGESLLLYWPAADPAPGMVVVDDASGLERAFDDECIACLSVSLPGFAVDLAQAGALPAWLPLDDFHRIALRSNAAGPASLSPEEAALVRWLYAAGAERVELWNDAAAESLMQSWHSGRRSGSIVLS